MSVKAVVGVPIIDVVNYALVEDEAQFASPVLDVAQFANVQDEVQFERVVVDAGEFKTPLIDRYLFP